MVKIGDKVNGIVIQKKLKAGGFGSVFLGQEEGKTNLWAIKVMSIEDETDKKAMQAEISVGLTLKVKNPCLVRYKEVLMKETECLIIMEYFVDGDLSVLIDKRKQKNEYFSVDESLSFLFQSCFGLKALHDNKIVHRDLKPQNVLVSFGKIFKISDYSIARKLDSSNTITMMASSGYTSPEILCGTGELTGKVDVYSIGCIFLQLLTLKHPFCNPNGTINLGNVMIGKVNSVVVELPPAVRALALSMIDLDCSKRPTVDAILTHPSVSGFVLTSYIHLFAADAERQSQMQTNIREQEKPAQKKSEKKKPEKIPLSLFLRPNGCAQVTSATTASATTLVGTMEGYVVLDTEMSTGIYRIVFGCDEHAAQKLWFGVVERSQMTELTASSKLGTVWVYHSGIYAAGKYCCETTLFPKKPRTLVAFELVCGDDEGRNHGGADGGGDAELYIYVDNILLPYVIINIPTSVFFFMSTLNGVKVSVESFQQLKMPTTNPSSPYFTKYKWG